MQAAIAKRQAEDEKLERAEKQRRALEARLVFRLLCFLCDCSGSTSLVRPFWFLSSEGCLLSTPSLFLFRFDSINRYYCMWTPRANELPVVPSAVIPLRESSSFFVRRSLSRLDIGTANRWTPEDTDRYIPMGRIIVSTCATEPIAALRQYR